jgi:glycosyltransferase involved in cell wall biosynthesis
MVLNGASVIERTLRPLKGAVDEIVFVDTGSIDGTYDKICRLADELGMVPNGIELKPETHPELYFVDCPETWRRSMPGPFTGRRILADWSAARNRTLDLCESKYVLKLDADDECMTPESLLPTLGFLDSMPGVDFVICPYEIMDRGVVAENTMQTRFWRNKPSIRFGQVMHERLADHARVPSSEPNWIMSATGLRFRDWKDSPGEGLRIARRNYKILLTEYERLEALGERMDPFFVFSLAEEALAVDPAFARELLIGSWCGTLRDAGLENVYMRNLGKSYEASGMDADALDVYLAAAALPIRSPGTFLSLGFLQRRLEIEGWRDSFRRAIEAAKAMNDYNFDLSSLKRANKLLEEG